MSSIESLLAKNFGNVSAGAVLLSARARIFRNISGEFFPGKMRNDPKKSAEILLLEREALKKVIGGVPEISLDMNSISLAEKRVLVERRIISRKFPMAEFAEISAFPSENVGVMLNGEDHFCIQILTTNEKVEELWNSAEKISKKLSEKIEFEKSENFGFLTARPANVGTGTRFSLVVHLPGLVLDRQMDKVVRALNMCGLFVRGWFGNGVEATGSVFEISNMKTLGVREREIAKAMSDWLAGIIEQEKNARRRVFAKNRSVIFDQISRIYGEMRFGFLASEAEALNGLSLLRMACDVKIFPEFSRAILDDLILEVQSGHIAFRNKIDEDAKNEIVDKFRGSLLRSQFAAIPPPNFSAF